MTTIKLHNTLTRKKEIFAPIDPTNVRMYVCGPTVYDRAHLGNARPVVVFDVLYRLLRHVYGEDHVTYARNFTDVDDKINATALSRKEAGASGSLEDLIQERTDETIRWYLDDMGALGALEPNEAPRATQFIQQMIDMTEALIASGHAYQAEGHVLFDVKSYADYGSLSGRSVDDMIAGARVEVAPYKRHPMDFVLWKPSSDDLPGWDSPWGRGRPGWHIECSAMTKALFGEKFDIHGGGLDLTFPHHENEKAQSCCEAGEDSFANYWMHNEMLQVEGKKMSKSLGNFFTVRDLLEQGVPGEVIRFVFLSTHYRKPMDWTAKKAEEARQVLEAWYNLVGDEPSGKPLAEVVEALADDLNTAGAVNFLKQLRYKVVDGLVSKADFLASVALLGIDLQMMKWPRSFVRERAEFPHASYEALFDGVDIFFVERPVGIDETIAREIAIWLNLRHAARAKKIFSYADELKNGLIQAGVLIQEGKSETKWEPTEGFDIANLPELPSLPDDEALK
jgi:cysteinyl-tRNA synthetase